MGAVVGMKEQPKNACVEANIALAGPVLGSVGAGAVAVAGAVTGSQLCLGTL